MHRLPQAREKLGLGTLDRREPTREFLPEDSPIESGSSQRLEAVPHQVQGVGEAVSVRVDQIVDRVDVHFVEDLQANRSKAVLGTNVVPKARHHERARGVSQILLRIPNVPDLRLKDLPGDLEECLGSHVFDPANLCIDLRDVIAHGLPRKAKVVIVEEAFRVLSEVCDESPDHLDVIWLHVARTRLTLAQMSRVDLHRFHLGRGNSSSGHRESYRGRPGIIPERYQTGREAPNVYPRPDYAAPGGRMARPLLRLATRFTRRTRATAWAIAFACMVLVGALSLVDGLAGGVGSVADRIGSGPAVYIRGTELLASAIEPDEAAGIPGDFVAVRAHPAQLEINNLSLSTTVVAVETYRNGTGTTAYPTGRNVSLDLGLRARVISLSG